MSSKAPARKPTLEDVLGVLEGMFGPPLLLEQADDPLLDHLLAGVLGLHVGLPKAREGIRALTEVFLDLNEARASPLSELEDALAPIVPPERLRAAANDVRMALQDVYDGTHGLDLEPLRGRDPEDQRTFLKDLPNTPGGPASLVFQVALGDQRLALGPRERHLLERFGLLPRAANVPRIRAAVEKTVPPDQRMRFTWLAGAGARLFEKDAELDASHPFVRLLVAGRAKELAEREKRRRQDELRRKAEEKRRAVEDAKQKRLDEIERKKREKEEARRAVEAARKQAREAALRKKEEARRAMEEKARAAKAEKQARKAAQEAARKAAVAARKAAQAAKKGAAKKPSAGKGAARKPAAKKPAPRRKR